MLSPPGLGDPRQAQQRLDVVALGHAHRPARLVDGDLDPELARSASTNTPIGASEPWSTMVPAQSKHDGLEMALGWLMRCCSPNRSATISSAMAKAVLAPVPLVTMTSRTRHRPAVDAASADRGARHRCRSSARPPRAPGRRSDARAFRPGSGRRPRRGANGRGVALVVVAVADDQPAVRALHRDQVDAVGQMLRLLGLEPRASAPRPRAARRSPDSGPARGRTSPPPAGGSRGSPGITFSMCSRQRVRP